MKHYKLLSFILLSLMSIQVQAKMVKVVLTGTLHEVVTMSVDTKEEKITALPYEFFVDKDKLPMTATFTSPNYEYQDIVINKKEEDLIGRYYILHSEKKSGANNTSSNSNNNANPVKTPNQDANNDYLDTSIDVNNPPSTSLVSDNTFALIIANEHYEMTKGVEMAQNDGLAFKEYCTKTLGISKNNIKYYPDATFGIMSKAFRDIKGIADAFEGKINLIVYYAGHGIPDNATKDAYIMPVDADGTDPNICYSLNKFYTMLKDMNLNQAVVFLDACFSGTQRDGDMIVAARGVAIKPKEEKPQGRIVVLSATSDEEAAYSYKTKQHGMFSYFLLKKLQETKGKTTLGELTDYVTKQVRQQSIVVNGKTQTPNLYVSDDIKPSWDQLHLYGK